MKTDLIITINNKAFNQAQLLDEAIRKCSNQSVPEWEQKVFRFILNWFDKNDFIIQKTSGSTGTPKEVKLKKSAMTASSKKTLEFFHLKEKDSAWLCLPVEYIAGKMMVVRALAGGLNLMITEPKSAPEIPVQTIDFCSMVPLQVKNLIGEKSDFTNIKKLIIGGAEVDHSLNKALQNIQTEVFATYGMTETCSHIALQRINGKNPDQFFSVLKGTLISINEDGCLTISSPDLSEKPIQTTDLAEIISPFKFRLIGRIDNIINSGGLKISSEQLEVIIKPIINHDCAIIPQPDELLGQRIVLVIEGKQNDFDKTHLLLEISKFIDRKMMPKAIYFIEQLPRGSSMKIDRNLLEQQFSNKY